MRKERRRDGVFYMENRSYITTWATDRRLKAAQRRSIRMNDSDILLIEKLSENDNEVFIFNNTTRIWLYTGQSDTIIWRNGEACKNKYMHIHQVDTNWCSRLTKVIKQHSSSSSCAVLKMFTLYGLFIDWVRANRNNQTPTPALSRVYNKNSFNVRNALNVGFLVWIFVGLTDWRNDK